MAGWLAETVFQGVFEWFFEEVLGIGKERRRIKHVQSEEKLGKRSLRRKRGKK